MVPKNEKKHYHCNAPFNICKNLAKKKHQNIMYQLQAKNILQYIDLFPFNLFKKPNKIWNIFIPQEAPCQSSGVYRIYPLRSLVFWAVFPPYLHHQVAKASKRRAESKPQGLSPIITYSTTFFGSIISRHSSKKKGDNIIQMSFFFWNLYTFWILHFFKNT